MNLVDQALVRVAVRDYAAGHHHPSTDMPTIAREVARTYLPQLVSRLGITEVSAEARRCIESSPDLLRRGPGERAAAIRRRGATARQLIEAAGRAARGNDGARAVQLIHEAIAVYPGLGTGDQRTTTAITALTEILLDTVPAPIAEITEIGAGSIGRNEEIAGKSA